MDRVSLEANSSNGDDFDFQNFREKLSRDLYRENTDLGITLRYARNWFNEKTGAAQHESILSLQDGRPVFTSSSGEKIDPITEYLGGRAEVQVIPGRDIHAARASLASRLIEIPEVWVKDRNRHQGLKYLHEVGHLILAAEDPNRVYVDDEIKMQLSIMELVFNDPKMACGDLISFMELLIESGMMSNLGIADRVQRDQFIRGVIDRIFTVRAEGREALLNLYMEISVTDFVSGVKNERDAWAIALKMMRKLKERGVTVDNRPFDEISLEVDKSLSFSVEPQFTFAVKDVNNRRKLGLPEHAEEKPVADHFALERMAERAAQMMELREEAGRAVREFMQIHDEDTPMDGALLTSPRDLDSRVINLDEEFDAMDYELEEMVRAVVQLLPIIISQQLNQPVSEGMKILGLINLAAVPFVDGRYQLSFRSIDDGLYERPSEDCARINANTFVFDERVNLRKLDETYPMRERENYLLAYRVGHGWEFVGKYDDLREEAFSSQSAETYEGSRIAKMLKDRGYTPDMIAEVSTGIHGIFSGFLRNKPET